MKTTMGKEKMTMRSKVSIKISKTNTMVIMKKSKRDPGSHTTSELRFA